MKLSLRWIFDHIVGDYKTQDVHAIVAKFNQVTAEIEHVIEVKHDLSTYFIAVAIPDKKDFFLIPELSCEYQMPRRTDIILLPEQPIYFLVKKNGDAFAWATLADFNVDKGGLVPQLSLDAQMIKGSWRSLFWDHDYLLEVDNKSITHRPDMWSHRGFAREIAAFSGLKFKEQHDFLTSLTVHHAQDTSPAREGMPFVVQNEAVNKCSLVNGFYLASFQHKPTPIALASRLMMVGARPMNAMVDITNYITLDWGQPVHAYDADKIAHKKIVVRRARQGETLDLLDGNKIELNDQDLVVADAVKPICLAGIKGGAHDSVSATTKSVFFEAANFDATMVRRSALHHKTRTDASMRFEKTLDPALAEQAVQRFVTLLHAFDMQPVYQAEMVSVGVQVKPLVMHITHDYIERLAGITLTADDIIRLLKPLEIQVQVAFSEPLTYEVIVPTFRSSKDIKKPEDIVEEIIRSYGFNNIPLVLPMMPSLTFDMTHVQRIRALRRQCAFGIGMVEQRNYSLFDEPFIQRIGLPAQTTVNIVNPVSVEASRMVTTLIPGLLKNVEQNMVLQDRLAFFEVGKVWHRDGFSVNELSQVAGIFFDKREPIDFYHRKHQVNSIIRSLGFLGSVTWQKSSSPDYFCYHPYQRAELWYEGKKIGVAGMLEQSYLVKLGALPESQAFIFELDAQFLLHEPIKTVVYHPVSRFQETFFDVSLQVPLDLTSEQIMRLLKNLDAVIHSVELIDVYQPKEATSLRCLTYRIWLQHPEKTLEKHEIDLVYRAALEQLHKQGITLRGA